MILVELWSLRPRPTVLPKIITIDASTSGSENTRSSGGVRLAIDSGVRRETSVPCETNRWEFQGRL